MTENPGYAVVTDLTTAGAIVWWRLTGETNLDDLRMAWEAAKLSLDDLPDNPSPQVAMSRAAGRLETKRRLVRPLPSTRGWAIVDEMVNPQSLELEYTQIATVSQLEGALQVTGTLPDAEFQQLQLDFRIAQSHLTVNDVSSWLSRTVVPLLDAVSLRDTGGVYFVPTDKVPMYRTMAQAIGKASQHRMFEVPALKSDEAVDAILDAVLREADYECTTLETVLDTGSLGKRALKSKVAVCEAMRAKVAGYEALLGRSMTAVQDRIESLKAGVVAAALTLDAEEEKKP